MFFRREREAAMSGLAGGVIGAAAAGYIVSRNGRRIPVDTNGNPLPQGQQQTQAPQQSTQNNQQQNAQGGSGNNQQQSSTNQNQPNYPAPASELKQQQEQLNKQQAELNRKREQWNNANNQQNPNNTTQQQNRVEPPPTPAERAAEQQKKQQQNQTQTQTPPSQKPPINTSQNPTTTQPVGGNTKPTTPNTTPQQPPKTTPQQNNNTQGQFKRPDNFDRNAARQAKWEAKQDRKQAGIERRNLLQSQQKTTAPSQPNQASNPTTGNFVRNTQGDRDTRRLIAMDRGTIPAQRVQQPGKVNPTGIKYAPGQNKPAIPTVSNQAVEAAKKTGQHIRDRRAADPLKDRIIMARRNAQAEFRKDRLKTEAYKTNATSALGRAGDRASTFFHRRGQDLKTGANKTGQFFKGAGSKIGQGAKATGGFLKNTSNKVAGSFKRGGTINNFARNTGKSIRNIPAKTTSGFYGGMSKALGSMSKSLGKASSRAGATSKFLAGAIKK